MPPSEEQIRSALSRLVQTGSELSRAAVPDGEASHDQFDESPVAATDPGKLASGYQRWYSESLAVVRTLLPDRVEEFEGLYRPAKGGVTPESVAGFLGGLAKPTHNGQHQALIAVANAISQQTSILDSAEVRLGSILADLRGVLQADLFDNELDAARHLAKNGHVRAAGAVAGVVLESHLGAVCQSHEVSLGRKRRSMSNLNDALKDASVIDIPQWRHIQGLGDIRNLCDHKGARDPKPEEIDRLIDETDRFVKELH